MTPKYALREAIRHSDSLLSRYHKSVLAGEMPNLEDFRTALLLRQSLVDLNEALDTTSIGSSETKLAEIPLETLEQSNSSVATQMINADSQERRGRGRPKNSEKRTSEMNAPTKTLGSYVRASEKTTTPQSSIPVSSMIANNEANTTVELANYNTLALEYIWNYPGQQLQISEVYEGVKALAIKKGLWNEADDERKHQNKSTRYQIGTRLALASLSGRGAIDKIGDGVFAKNTQTNDFIQRKLNA